MASEQSHWASCGQDDCAGIKLPTAAWCLAHAAEQAPDAFQAELKRISAEGTVDMWGQVISAELLARVLDATPRKDGRPTFTAARFDRATFPNQAGFDGATFEDTASFDGTTFKGDTKFGEVTFESGAGFAGATFQGWVGFGGAIFEGPVKFEEATFGSAWFGGATFKDTAWFDRATFKGAAWFDGATFEDTAWFDGATFEHAAGFGRATFNGEAGFGSVTFKDGTGFGGATFNGEAGFGGATFKGMTWFVEAAFNDEASFVLATFEGPAGFGGATFQGKADFGGATFELAQFGPVLVARQLSFEAATFKERVQIDAAAATLCADRASFRGGVQLRLRWAQVVLDDADLAAPSILTGVPPFTGLDEDQFARVWGRGLPPAPGRDDRPRLLSVRRADVAGLTVANADLRACRFMGAHNLDKLRVEGNANVGNSPNSWWWTTRQTIAEEHHWRSGRTPSTSFQPGNQRAHRPRRHSGWYPTHRQPPHWLDVETVTPAQLATLYRALRKGREDSKDEPGAADFYYGEMEMRRQARNDQAQRERRQRHWGTWTSARTEHAILWVYWLVSGYGLRAWRAVAAVAAVLVLFAMLCAYGGGYASQVPQTAASARSAVTTMTSPAPASTTPDVPRGFILIAPPTTTATADTSFGGAMVYGARTAIGLTRDPQPRLTRWGDVLQVLLRIIAPVLLGLAILSIRGRVKR